MKNRLVTVPSIKHPIMPSPGFAKKGLSDFKLDLMALCGFGCSYCSSNEGNYLRIHRETFADATEEQLGERLYPASSPDLTMLWPDVIEKLEAQMMSRAPKRSSKPLWGSGQTLVFSMLTDGFSPVLVGNGTTEAALRLVLVHTQFRIRVLTKNAVVGSARWIEFFLKHPGRFVVGLSCGTLDGNWAAKVERGTSAPKTRIEALHALQDAGVPTYGMLCPVFPDALAEDRVEQLVAAIRPEMCETVWAEPYNDRANWQRVHAGYEPDSHGAWVLRDIYMMRTPGAWSRYAADLYTRLRAALGSEAKKLRYLLYEDQVRDVEAPLLASLEGILLQSKPDDKTGKSQNPCIAKLQTRGPLHGRVEGPR